MPRGRQAAEPDIRRLGAANYGIDGLLIAHGIHREELIANGAINPSGLETLLATSHGRKPIAAMPTLAW